MAFALGRLSLTSRIAPSVVTSIPSDISVLLHETDQRVHCDGAAARGSNDDGVDVELEESINICFGVARAGQGRLYKSRNVGWGATAITGEQFCHRELADGRL